MALNDEEQKALEAKIKDLEAKAAKAPELEAKLAETSKANADLNTRLSNSEQEKVTLRIKNEYPELAEAIGSLVVVGSYEAMKASAEKLKAFKGSPAKEPAKEPAEDVKQEPAAGTPEHDAWRKAGHLSPASDVQDHEAEKQVKERYIDAFKRGDARAMVDTILKRSQTKVKKFFNVA